MEKYSFYLLKKLTKTTSIVTPVCLFRKSKIRNFPLLYNQLFNNSLEFKYKQILKSKYPDKHVKKKSY
jgi:hypothetical protein